MSYFYNAPTCKALSLATVAFPALRYLNTALPHSPATEIASKLLATLTPAYPYLILPLIVLWKYRVIERRLGTWQFIQLAFFGTLISLLVTRVTHLFVTPGDSEIAHVLFSLICVLFPLFLAELPLHFEIVSLLVSENALVGFILLQSVLLDPNTGRAALVSFAVGAILEQSWRTLHHSFHLSLPEKLREVGEALFKWFPDHIAPRLPWTGATLEAQRSQFMDQQETLLRNIPHRNPLAGWMGGRRWGANLQRGRPRARPRVPAPTDNLDNALPPHVTQEKVQQLCDMGFNRENAMIALSHSGGELEVAAAILLAEKS